MGTIKRQVKKRNIFNDKNIQLNIKIFPKELLTSKSSKRILTKEENENRYQMTRKRMVKNMPLSMAPTGEVQEIKRIGGNEETRRFLENLGFVAGGNVTIVSEIDGNLIVSVKESRVAISKEMANRIIV